MNQTITLPRSVVEQSLRALENTSPLGFNMESDKKFYAAITTLRAALQQPDAGIPASVPEGWKLVPVDPTREMKSAGAFAAARANAMSYSPVGTYIPVDAMALMSYRAMLTAAPQPPTTEQSSAVQPQGEHGPVGFVRPGDIKHLASTPSDWVSMFGQATGYNTVPLYLHPQPKREPLTLEQIAVAFGWKQGCLPLPKELLATRTIERDGIGGEE